MSDYQCEIQLPGEYAEYVVSNLCQILDLRFDVQPWKMACDTTESVFYVKNELDPQCFILTYFRTGDWMATIVVRCPIEFKSEVEACLEFWDRNARQDQDHQFRDETRLTQILEKQEQEMSYLMRQLEKELEE